MIYLQLFLAFIQIGFFSFGGGLAALPLIEKVVVENHHWLGNGEFIELVTISELSPGPIGINSATFTGFKVGGIFGSFIATIAFCLPSVLLVYLVFHFIFYYKKNIFVKKFLLGLRPSVIALMSIAGFSIAEKGISDWFSVVVGIVIFIFIYRKKTDPILLLFLAGISGLVWYRG
ncbi:chromate transporter [Atribacter laminatus]|uniref:Putative chromate transport protein n=1 Tax=Atribacter laminatus TaxID=2847778 RepID=A0A7T1F3P7_ATRLM|nr:chromate transporter [Atribacter laminatus]QPM69107.1 putative chromate transport protein [Atribacter laminatus]